jgi:ATP-dependent helicase IRC3
MNKMPTERMFYRQYDLSKARSNGSKKKLETYQRKAVDHFFHWYSDHKAHSDNAGEILYLPTGAGKTHVAIRFLCIKPLSEGYKILWLAHTHSLLEQAFYSFEEHVNEIAGSRLALKVRVVSGTKGHFRVQAINSNDDVIIATLQTITKAYNERHPALESFLNSTDGKIFVVFDEAHHAPAPSYRRLILNLRERYPEMYLLGLTATPSYSDEKKEGWLGRIFPQGFRSIVSPSELMAQGVLSKPNAEPVNTEIIPDFDEREYKKWLGTFQDDLPEEIITKLALNKDRNLKIAKYYADNSERFGKTIIFADRWFQCDAISVFLEKQGIKNGTIYTHDDNRGNDAAARNKQKDTENDRVLEAFRKNEIKVILNIRMLTEGTDIPDVQTVFITRQTTSQNLLTQMVGRALRGPKFGGTKIAWLVFFIDNWQQLINWADYRPLVDSIITDDPKRPVKHLPIEPISIELVRKLAEMMYRPDAVIESFKSLLPLGWYMVEYFAKMDTSDLTKSDVLETNKELEDDLSIETSYIREEIVPVRRLVMVFDHEEDCYKRLIEYLINPLPIEFEDESIQFKDVEPAISAWQRTFFPSIDEHFGSNLAQDIFSIVRHIAQNNKPPKFFEFEERDNHDLSRIAKYMVEKKFDRITENQELLKEYNSKDRYWNVFYPSYDQFYKQYNICIASIINLNKPVGPIIAEEEQPEDEEPPEERKREVRDRDGKCLCCGLRTKRYLEVDHIMPKHHKISHQIDNLQTLCKKCNGLKKEKYIDFTATSFSNSVAAFKRRKINNYEIDLKMPQKELPEFDMPSGIDAKDPSEWERFLSRTVNFFYKCGSVQNVQIKSRGDSFYHWQIELYPGNDPMWIKPHLRSLLNRIRSIKRNMGYRAPNSITVSAPNKPSANIRLSVK